MNILHGTWIPDEPDPNEFIQEGCFCLWVETAEVAEPAPADPTARHPQQLSQAALADFLVEQLGFKPPKDNIYPQYFLLPTHDQQPLPSLELSRYLETELPETFEWDYWQIDCLEIPPQGNFQTQSRNLIQMLNELHFLASTSLTELQLGADLLFWYHYSQSFKQIVFRDHYVPALKYRVVQSQKTGSKQSGSKQAGSKQAGQSSGQFKIYPGWEIISNAYEQEIERFVDYMPLLCVSGFIDRPTRLEFHQPEWLLRHFSECFVTHLLRSMPSTAAFSKKFEGTLVEDCLRSDEPVSTEAALVTYQQWQNWRDKITRSQTNLPFYLCFRLHSPEDPKALWFLEFLVAGRDDPSTRVSLLDYWQLSTAKQKSAQSKIGKNFEQHLLMQLGYAARIYPKLWEGLETDQPTGVQLSTDEASSFLKDLAWVLEESGYKVIVPAWWTPKGQQRAKIRLRASGRKLGSNSKSKGYFSLETLVDYQYELAINGEPVSEREWQALVNAKSSLVQFRGEWMELDQDQMQQMLEFWKSHKQEHPELSLIDFVKLMAEGDDFEVELSHDQALAEMLSKLNDKSGLEVLPDPQQFQGQLREYQKRGVSWISYLESIGFNGCLADDMGLGKSAQVIARLLQEREQVAQKSASKSASESAQKSAQKSDKPLPTLLIAPTSVVGNWQKEIEKFAPQLRSMIHHGSDRNQEPESFRQAVAPCDVVITSFTLARKDEKLLNGIEWQRLVVDEAQNIKNPKAAQTKAILKLSAQHRLALTGTPIENRLLDLWSIFNFLNPGYLGKESQFRQSFETPIQKNSDPSRSAVLKKLVEPFILRRVKTDPTIIQDLPDKVEQKLFCNLTKEQAALYEALVKDVERQLEDAEGIQRKGLILSTLLKLKQICNHPMQFLQDGSAFTPERSHKLERLQEMVEEAVEEGESLLVFTQFTEIGEALERYVKHHLHYNTYYLHGGTVRQKREKMIAEFQDPETEPSVFVLSLKAGGVGITLTKANHVFHFDRWWNPAVENQATDRAFRIGQKKNVFVHKFVTIGTLEEKIDQMIEDKKKLANSIVGSDESWLTELDNNAFKQLIRLNRSAVME
ncbi:MAG: DEAD/DEAH box helicase [Pegethrix bostrychoides GSE-TBD4-15B]|jgi:SNF2 family DNA or RNA helicase|uniref:DEAD/DEAH box helicase n=1 Tax=Pegethrix bostrychoides GSE-TBD4-15B TaxID=2839662 RepID=A0A951U567_9CYAN|nr:DEAD/DEAH box helicase [Pegethrix bostrychoides GSE-TBD4-15B]